MVVLMQNQMLAGQKAVVGLTARPAARRTPQPVRAKDPFTSDPQTAPTSDDVVGCAPLPAAMPCSLPVGCVLDPSAAAPCRAGC